MPYLDSWDSFQTQAETLYRSRPLHTRYVLKYRHCDGRLVLKVTDDVVCLKYSTDQQADLKKVEALNNTFFRLMARGADAPETDAKPTAETEAAAQQQQQQQQQQQPAAATHGRKSKRRGG